MVFIILYLVFQIHTDINSYNGLKSKTEHLGINFEREKEKQKELKSLIAKLEKQDFVEQIAREKINLVKNKEQAYKIWY